MEKVLCKDCKHSFRHWYELPWGNLFLRCKLAYSPETIDDDPVTGPKKVDAYYALCRLERSKFNDKGCGDQGKFWAPKNKTDLFKLIKHISQ